MLGLLPKAGPMDTSPDGGPRLMRLRYGGACEVCGVALPARSQAWYEPTRRRVRCPGCPAPGEPATTTAEVEVPSPLAAGSVGHAGASARREYEARSARHRARTDAKVAADDAWRRQVKQDHPLVGRMAAVMTPRPDTRVPQHVKAWQTGSDGEEKLGRRLDVWAAAKPGRFVMHDRRVPGTRANIDHLVVAPSGVWVIDAKEYSGRVEEVNAGGVFRPDWRLKVGGRNRSKLADGVHWQRQQVIEVLDRLLNGQDRPPVIGTLCFVGAEWSLFQRPFVFAGIHVAWPAATVELLSAPGASVTKMDPSIPEELLRVFAPA